MSHIDDQGRASMVDVGDKPTTARVAIAQATLTMRPDTLALITEGRIEKGDVFTADLVETWIDFKRGEVDAIRLRPHPWEFAMYYDI